MNRRNFIRTASGFFALPWLESFAAGQPLSASSNVATPPIRFATLFFPNGVYPTAWTSAMTETGLQLSDSLSPLAPFVAKTNLIEGLDNPLGGHLGQTSGYLSGIDFEPDEQGIVRGAISLDQMLAREWGKETFVPSLNLALEPPSEGGFGNRPRSYGNSISWSGPATKVEPLINPQQAFDYVFFGQTEAGRKAAARRKRIVDDIWVQTKAIQPKISELDHQKLQQYLDSLRDLQVKLDKAIHPFAKEWTSPSPVTPERPEESGIPTNHQEHMRLMMELTILALQTDSTRVSTLVMGHSISRIVFDFVDKKLTRNHHDFSHHRNDPKKIEGYNQITSWMTEQCAWMLGRMEAINEGQGTLLDNSVVLFGSGMKDGNVHEPKNVPTALIGSAGGRLKTHRRIECPDGSVLSQLHLSLLELFQMPQDNFNDVTSRTVPGLV